jgi:MFS family permease
LAIFTLAPFAGPALGPTVAGYVVVAGLSWRWVFWISTFFVSSAFGSTELMTLTRLFQAGVCWLQIIFTMPETYAYVFSDLIPGQCINEITFRPVLLVKVAQRKRQETGDQRYYAAMERETFSILQRIEHILAKPFKILFREPMLIAITAYMSVRAPFQHSCPQMLIRTLVYLWMYLSSFRGLSHRFHRRTPLQCWCFGPDVFTHSRWWCHCCHRGTSTSTSIYLASDNVSS